MVSSVSQVRKVICRLFPIIIVLSLTACGSPSPAPSAASPSAAPSLPTIPTVALSPTAVPAGTGGFLFINGDVLTMDEDNPSAQAVAVVGDRILAVGTNDEILALKEASTQVIDLQGQTVTPGFIDSHQHRIGNRIGGGYEQPEPIIQLAVEQGWTSLNEQFVHEQRLDELRSLDEAGKLRVRVNAYLGLHSPEGDPYGNWYQAYEPGFEYSPYLRLRGVKIFMDHGWGLGNLIWTQAELDQMVLEAHQLGWQLAVHTAGEPAHEMILNSLEKALGGQADDRYRHRIEHVVVISDNDIQRMKRLGIIASFQLNGPGTWVDYSDFDPGTTPEMFPHMARWRDLIEADVFVVGSSDWPWGTLEEDFGSPMLLLYQAVTRTGTNRRPPEDWMRGQELTMQQAYRALTINGAYATFEEDKKGSIESGKLADLVILSQNPLTAPIEEVPDIQILMTMIGGKVEYCAAGSEALCPSTSSSAPDTGGNDPFIGNWTTLDPDDGSNMSLQITRNDDAYEVILIDEKTSACGLDESGNPKFAAEIVAAGRASGNVLSTVVTTIKCLTEPPSSLDVSLTINYTYESATDTLVDDSDHAVWMRR